MLSGDGDCLVSVHVDKPRHTRFHLMWGCAVWEPQFTELIRAVLASSNDSGDRAELVLGDAIDEALRRGMRVAGYELPAGLYVDIGTHEGLLEAQALLAKLPDASPAPRHLGPPTIPVPTRRKGTGAIAV